MKILITGGGCEEPVDNVRCISNVSTGKTSSFLAEYFAECGWDVTCIMAEKAVKPEVKVKILTYRTFADLQSVLEAECKTQSYDAVIHAAAVSDFSPETISVDGKEYKAGAFTKIPSGSELIIKMKKNPKLLDYIKKWCGPETKVAGFKLTSNADEEQRKSAVKKLFSPASQENIPPDFVVSNDLSEITKFLHPCTIYNQQMKIEAEVKSLVELAQWLYNLFCQDK